VLNVTNSIQISLQKIVLISYFFPASDDGDRAMTEAVSRRPVTAKILVESQADLYGICGVQTFTEVSVQVLRFSLSVLCSTSIRPRTPLLINY